MIEADALASFAWQAAILLAGAVSLVVVLRVTASPRRPVEVLRSRFVLGIPWGSAIVLCIVGAVYLFVQGGIDDITNPVFLPYVNWSYFYPTGVLFAPFAHGSLGHLLSNVSLALILAPLAEYVYGHYPEEDPYRVERSLRRHPLVRALLIFPGAVIVVAVFSSIFAWGPVIGFSGVVFAFAGFAAVKFPIVTIVALLAQSALLQFGDALLNPVVVAEVQETVSEPGWAGVSFQGHALGFLVGIVLALAVLHRRRAETPADPLRLWFGLVVLGTGMSLWAIWFGAGAERFVLYQGLGMILILLGAGLVALAAGASARPLLGRMTRRQVAVSFVIVPLVLIASIAVPLNVLTVVDHDPPEEAIQVGDYDVYYATDVESSLRPALEVFDDEDPGTASGLIVASEERHFWTTAITSSDLQRSGDGTVHLGGLFWSSEVAVDREGWSPVGNDSVYRVEVTAATTSSLTAADRERTADPVIGGHSIAIASEDDEFVLRVTDRDGETTTGSIPELNETATIGEISFERPGDELVATYDGTTVTVAEREG